LRLAKLNLRWSARATWTGCFTFPCTIKNGSL
jgi:hypothetical protein